MIFSPPSQQLFFDLYINYNFQISPTILVLLSFSCLLYLLQGFRNRFRWLVNNVVKSKYIELLNFKGKLDNLIKIGKYDYHSLNEQFYDLLRQIDDIYSLKFLRMLKIYRYKLIKIKNFTLNRN